MKLLMLAVVFGAGCTCESGHGRRGPDAAEAGAGVTSSNDEWTEGRLPASITQGTPRRGGQVTMNIRAEPPSLNLITHADLLLVFMMRHHVSETLVSLDPYDHPNYQIVPELAERWDVSEDGKVYTFHLRRGVKWHDGRAFTARDVVATFDKVQDPAVTAQHVRSYTEDLVRYEAVDDFTVRFTFSRPYFLALDSPFSDVVIQPAHIIGRLSGAQYNAPETNPMIRSPMGTGPFRFVEWVTGQRIVIERNPNYWGTQAHLDRVVFRIVLDVPIALQLAERGELDHVDRVPADLWSRMDNPALRRDFHRSRFFDNNYAWIGWNLERPMFADVRVRRALTMLIDISGMLEHLFYGVYRPTTCPFFWEGSDCDPAVQPLPHDPAQALRLLDEAGWRDSDGDGIRDKAGTAFRFTFMVPARSDDTARMATKMKEDFERAGIDMALQRIEWSTYSERLRSHDFDVCSLLWGQPGGRLDPWQIWHSSSANGGSNYISYRNPRADELMNRARPILDPAARQPIYRELHRLLYEEQPYTWLYVRPRLELISRRIHGVRQSLMWWQFEDWWVDPPASGH